MIEDWIHYFEPANYTVVPSFEGDNDDRLNSQIVQFHQQPTIDWDTVQAVIIGVSDARNSLHKGSDKAPNAIRQHLYGLRTISKDLQIIDMGNLLGKTIDDRYIALEEIIVSLIHKNVFPIILGGGQDYTLPLTKAINKTSKGYRLAVIDSKIDWLSPEKDFSASSYLGYICKNEESAPHDISIIGVQKYLFSQAQEDYIKKSSHEFFRLGDLRQKGIKAAEPYIRDADLLSVDLTSVRQSDQPARHLAMPNGLTGEELCQLMWYAGLSDKLKTIGLFELDVDLDDNNKATVLTAQSIWHILEGLALRYNDYPIKDLNSYRTFIVHLEDYELDIKFYNNPDNDRWWVEIPNDNIDNEIVACDRQDFESASEREIPERWFRFIKKKRL